MVDRTITTEATGSAAHDPERGVVELTATGGSDSPGDARIAAERAAERVEDALSAEWTTRRTEIRVSETADFEWADDPYLGTVEFEIHCDPGDASDVAIAGSDAGAEIDAVEFELTADTRATLYDRALEDAVGRARRRARTVARSEGVDLGDVVSLETGEREESSTLVDAALAVDPGHDIHPTPIRVEVDVTGTYRIQ